MNVTERQQLAGAIRESAQQTLAVQVAPTLNSPNYAPYSFMEIEPDLARIRTFCMDLASGELSLLSDSALREILPALRAVQEPTRPCTRWLFTRPR